MTFPVIIDSKKTKKDDGDNLQKQGNNGELNPHVSGVGRHPKDNTGYLAQTPIKVFFFRVVLCRAREESGVWF